MASSDGNDSAMDVVVEVPTPTPNSQVVPTPTPNSQDKAVVPTPTPNSQDKAVVPTPTPNSQDKAEVPTPTPNSQDGAVVPTPTPNSQDGAVVPTPTPNSQDNDPKKTRVKEVERILKCEPEDWYDILNVERNCNPLVARRAAIKILLLIKDRFETGPEDMKSKSNQATKLVSEAAEQLKAGNSFVEVDGNGRTAKPPAQSEPYTPSSAVKEIYKQATGSVLILFSGAADTGLAELEIHQYNETIRDTVLKENRDATILQQISGFIDLKTISSYIALRRQHEYLQARETTILSRSEKAKSANSTKILGQMGSVIDEFNARKGYPLDWNWDKQKNPGVWIAKPSDTTDQEAPFPPGQTKDGDTILGCLPIFKLDFQGGQYVERCEFAIEVDDEENLGNMKIATWEEIGQEAGQAYLDLPDEEKLFIPHSEARYCTPLQKKQFRGLVGFWADYSANKHRWGRAYCWIDLENGGYDVVNKACFEKIVGRKDLAMVQIKDLFDNDESKFIWRTQPVGRTSKSIREGPYGLVPIQKRKMIENGPQLATGKADNTQLQNLNLDPELAAELARLRKEGEMNRAQLEAQNADLQAKFEQLFIEIQKLQL